MLSRVQIISFEIGDECNLKKMHRKCPINERKFLNTKFGRMTPEIIAKAIDEAKKMRFNGYFAFHFYNEPMLYQEDITKVINMKKGEKYLLWTNGTYLKKGENKFLELFQKVVITCYDHKRLSLYNELKEKYGNIVIQEWELDDRLSVYRSTHKNYFGCKRINFELPIDCYGNVHLCCRDWNNTYEIGNIKESGLTEVIKGNAYQNISKKVSGRLLQDDCPEVCKVCTDPWLRLPKDW